MTTLVTTLNDQTILTLEDGLAEDGYIAALTIWDAVAGALGIHCDGLRVWTCDNIDEDNTENWSLFCEINYCTHER